MPAHRIKALSAEGVQEALLRYLAPAEDADAVKSLPPRAARASYFYSTERPVITVVDYVNRVLFYCKLSESVVVYALVLLRRVAQADPQLVVNPYNVNRLLITAVLIAAKTVDSVFFTNDFYQRVGGIATLREMNRLEVEFLKILDYRVFVSYEELTAFYLTLSD